jgi:hypothetical protein
MGSSTGGRVVGGTWRRLYSKAVEGRGPGPRRRGGAAVVAQPRTGETGDGLQLRLI